MNRRRAALLIIMAVAIAAIAVPLAMAGTKKSQGGNEKTLMVNGNRVLPKVAENLRNPFKLTKCEKTAKSAYVCSGDTEDGLFTHVYSVEIQNGMAYWNRVDFACESSCRFITDF